MKLLIVEDDKLLQEGLLLALSHEGYACDCADTAKEADALISSAHYSLVILDLGLPDEDGLTLLSRWRKNHYQHPVLILTARDKVNDRVSGLDVGADDYLAKPFALTELQARVRALIRRNQGSSNSKIQVDNITLDLNNQQVLLDGKPVVLTPKEFAILSRLVLKAGSQVHREVLHQDIYAWNDDPSSNSLEVHIHNLRHKIGKDRIRTLRGFGYLLTKGEQP
ncbi:two-component system response regulator BasR [Pectobacterium odoriferum]|nr:two-component system response regulator PmrA [Pectobacterium odoriferum]POD96031.1 two-component system response regulator BasR [Pectobacterium odoriferum]POE08164.1 two-component system response regulator BasR [Pectobacterium odoriferum]POE13400.1 two-component system response regulator BasR [Pectobacterium odoriferum]POE21735.1 two-component system response regulator BasR [Pectobacterium odoriferum]POE26597.1 two-component system response regulator BasR [Pectobacterium odoriferum]